MSSFFDYVGADMTAEGGDKRQKKPQSVIERLERAIEDGRLFRSISQADMRALIAVAKAARECLPAIDIGQFKRYRQLVAAQAGHDDDCQCKTCLSSCEEVRRLASSLSALQAALAELEGR
jgi:hypothetical protein